LLPGRTDNDIKNRWHTHLSKIGKQNESQKRTIDFWTELELACAPMIKEETSDLEMFFQLF
jgi:hypothetical protein